MVQSFYIATKAIALGMMLCMMCSCNQTKYTPTNAAESTEVETEETEEEKLASEAYEKGYDVGMTMHTNSLDLYTKNDEKNLKDNYMMDCRATLGKENYNNKALYKEYRRGFLKGYEDGNNALQ
jgi:subtilase family serine protease